VQNGTALNAKQSQALRKYFAINNFS